MEVKSYRDLRVWQAVMDLDLNIYQLTETYPKQELFNLTNQMRRAATSIPTFIAEGHTREELRDDLLQIDKAQGILSQLQTLLDLSGRLGHLKPEQVERTLDQTVSLAKQLCSLRNALRRGS